MKQKFLKFIKRHWLKLSLLVLICNPLSLTLMIIILGLIQDFVISGSSYTFSNYIGREIKVAPFAGIDKTRWSSGWEGGSYYISTRALAHNSLRGSGEAAQPLGEYVNLKVYDVKLRSSGLFKIFQVCLLNDSKNLKQSIFEDCAELSKVEAVTKFFFEAENEIKKFGSAYVSFAEKFSYRSIKPILDEGTLFTYKVSSRAELVELITPNDLAFDHYYWIMYEANPVLVKNRAKFDL